MDIFSSYKPAKLHVPKGLSADWYAYFFYRDPKSGKFILFKQRKGINRCKTTSEKKRFGAMLVSEINLLLKDGWSPFSEASADLRSLKEILDELYKLKEASLRRRTWQSYKYSLDVLYAFLQEKNYADMLPEQFSLPVAIKFTDWLQTSKKFKGKSFNSCKNNIGMFFNMMVERGLIDKNPFAKIKNQREEVGKNIAFTPEQKEKIGEYLRENNYRLYLFTQFIYFCYIRPLELLRLKVSNVDLPKRIITIYGNQSKNKKTETVVIPAAFVARVEEMQLEKHSPDDYLFGYQLLTCSKPYSRNRVTQQHTDALTELKMPAQVTMYSHKHTGVVNAYKAGIDIYSIMRQCRHHSIQQTQTYLKSLGLVPNVEFSEKMT